MSLIDITRKKIEVFPIDYYELLTDFENLNISQILQNFDSDSEVEVIEFIKFLLTNDYAYLSDTYIKKTKHNFEICDLTGVRNAIIDFDQVKLDFYNIFSQLSNLKCKEIQIRGFSNLYTLDELGSILTYFFDSKIESVEMILKFDTAYSEFDYVNFFKNNILLNNLIIFSSPYNKNTKIKFSHDDDISDRKIYFTKEHLNVNSCGIIDKAFFTIDIENIAFNKKFNSCLKNKISIDANGMIKNCPSFSSHYGNISKTSLESVFQQIEFHKIGIISKDKVKVCNVCEYRLICSDCRVYTQNADIFGKPTKCNYDPTT